MKRKMAGSIDFSDFCIEPATETNTIPIDCWQTISLSDICIPSHLLLNRNKGSNARGTQVIYHTLQKKDVSKYSKSFSVYIDSSIKNEQEDIFHSDSNEDIDDSTPMNNDNTYFQNIGKIDFKGNNSSSALKEEFSEQLNNFKCMQNLKGINENLDSHISLKEIIDDASVTSLKDYVCDFEYKKNNSDISSIYDKQKLNSKKSRKDKKGKKIGKSVPLTSLFEDMNTTQEFNCNKYMNSILQERERHARVGDNPLCNKEEYPDLTPEELTFIHSDSIVKEESVKLTPTFPFAHSDKGTRGCLVVPNSENLNDFNEFQIDTTENVEAKETSNFMECGEIVIENIPLDVNKDDIISILYGYGEIRNFSMISTGKCLKVCVEIDLICDIDWVIECLNGSEPFGTSTGVLKCYQKTE